MYPGVSDLAGDLCCDFLGGMRKHAHIISQRILIPSATPHYICTSAFTIISYIHMIDKTQNLLCIHVLYKDLGAASRRQPASVSFTGYMNSDMDIRSPARSCIYDKPKSLLRKKNLARRLDQSISTVFTKQPMEAN